LTASPAADEPLIAASCLRRQTAPIAQRRRPQLYKRRAAHDGSWRPPIRELNVGGGRSAKRVSGVASAGRTYCVVSRSRALSQSPDEHPSRQRGARAGMQGDGGGDRSGARSDKATDPLPTVAAIDAASPAQFLGAALGVSSMAELRHANGALMVTGVSAAMTYGAFPKVAPKVQPVVGEETRTVGCPRRPTLCRRHRRIRLTDRRSG
jgi:hypothetical protein